MEITDFIRARLEEDRTAALQRMAEGEDPYVNTEGSPQRTIAEVDAKRAIVNGMQPWGELDDGSAGTILRVFARIYQDHPDFDPSWKMDNP